MNPWLGILIVMATLGVLLGAVRAAQYRFSLHPELSRKLAHIIAGGVPISFPWLFESPLPVLALSGIAIAGMLAVRFLRRLKETVGGVIHGVERQSFGELYLPLSVAILFPLTHQTPLLFCVPMMMLAFADAVSALVGVRFGFHKFTTDEGHKSVEGSAAFVIVTFLVVFVPLFFFTEKTRAEVALIAAMLGFLVMLLEAAAWRGLDNLFIPLGGFLLLKVYLELPMTGLVTRFVVVILLTAFSLWWRRKTTLTTGAVLGSVFVLYVIWALTDWRWIVPPLVVFVGYTLLSPRTERNSPRIHGVPAILSVSGAGLGWLFLSLTAVKPEFYYLFTLSFAAHLAIIGIARFAFDYPAMPRAALLATCILKGWLLVLAPYYFIERMGADALTLSLWAGVAVTIAALLFFFLQPNINDCPSDTARWWRQGSIAAIASLLGLVPLYWF